MKSLQIGLVVLVIIFLFGIVLFLGIRLFSSTVNPTAVPNISQQQASERSPKIVQTDTQVVIFENPLVDQAGMSVEEVLNRRDELLGQEIVVKGEVARKERELGFWLNEAGADRFEVFVVTDKAIANPSLNPTVLDDREYARVTGTLKMMIWTDEETLEDASASANNFSSNDRLVIVARELSPIEL